MSFIGNAARKRAVDAAEQAYGLSVGLFEPVVDAVIEALAVEAWMKIATDSVSRCDVCDELATRMINSSGRRLFVCDEHSSESNTDLHLAAAVRKAKESR